LHLTVKSRSKKVTDECFGQIMCRMEFSMAAVRKIFHDHVQEAKSVNRGMWEPAEITEKIARRFGAKSNVVQQLMVLL